MGVILLLLLFLGKAKNYTVPNLANKMHGATLTYFFLAKKELMVNSLEDHGESDIFSYRFPI